MTEVEKIEEAGADTAPLSNVVKWVRAFVDVWRRRRPTPLAMVATVRPVGRDDDEQPLGDLVSDGPPLPPGAAVANMLVSIDGDGVVTTVPIACQSTEATAEAAVVAALQPQRRKVVKAMAKTSGASKAKPRKKNKAKRVLPVLLLCGAALGMSACGVKLPAVSLAPTVSGPVVGGSMPSFGKSVTTKDGVTLGGGDLYINPAAILGLVSGYVAALVTPAPVVEPASPLIGTVGPKAGGV